MATIPPTNFEVVGLNLNNKVLLLSGDTDPRAGSGTDAPIGSMYLRTNNESWKKFGVGTQDWGLDTGSGIDDDSAYAKLTRSVLVTSNYLVEFDVGLVIFNHYYETDVSCNLAASNLYKQPITIKNVSGLPLLIQPTAGCRIDGRLSHVLTNRFSAITISPLSSDWIITSSNLGHP